jgi:hypothetical protein
VRAPIKAFLMDQRRIAGLGNIYVAEALFRAGIHPAAPRVACAPRAADLLAAIRAVLEGGIARRGTTLRDYVDADGRSGENAPRCWFTGAPASRAAAAAPSLSGASTADARRFSVPAARAVSGSVKVDRVEGGTVGRRGGYSGQSAPRRSHFEAYNADSALMPLRLRVLPAPSRSRKGSKATPAAVERSIDFDDGARQIRIGRRADLELSLPFSPLSGVHARLLRASDADQKTEHWVARGSRQHQRHVSWAASG